MSVLYGDIISRCKTTQNNWFLRPFNKFKHFGGQDFIGARAIVACREIKGSGYRVIARPTIDKSVITISQQSRECLLQSSTLRRWVLQQLSQ